MVSNDLRHFIRGQSKEQLCEIILILGYLLQEQANSTKIDIPDEIMQIYFLEIKAIKEQKLLCIYGHSDERSCAFSVRFNKIQSIPYHIMVL